MNWTINQTVDLSRGYTPVVWPDALMVSGDVGAHTWRLTVLDNGVPADLSGATITGSFLRDDGATVQVAGSVSGSVVSVTLTNACYAIEGKLVGTMRVVLNGKTITLAAVIFTVKLLTSGDVIDPGIAYQNFTIDASPAGTYADLAALNAADPDHAKIYITLDDDKWCYHNGSAFVAGGVYLSSSYDFIFYISDGIYPTFSVELWAPTYMCVAFIATGGSFTYSSKITGAVTTTQADLATQLGTNAILDASGLKIGVPGGYALVFSTASKTYAVKLSTSISASDSVIFYGSSYGAPHGKLTELSLPNYMNNLIASSKHGFYVSDSGTVTIENSPSTGAVIVNIPADCLALIFVSHSKELTTSTSTVATQIGEASAYSAEDGLTITLNPRYALVFNVELNRYAVINVNTLAPKHLVLVYNGGYRNPMGYLVSRRNYLEINDVKSRVTTLESSGSTAFIGIGDIETKVSEFTDLFNDSGDAESFVFFTDPHLLAGTNYYASAGNYINAIKQYYDSTPTSFVVSGGDWIDDSDTQKEACFKLGFIDGFMKTSFDRHYMVVGNHDTNYQGYGYGAPDYNYVSILTDNTIRNLWFRDYGKAYYSFRGAQTTFYVLDCGLDAGALNMNAYRWEQIEWLANKLLDDDAPHSAVFAHMFYYNEGNVAALMTNLTALCAAYNAHTSITLNNITYNFSACTGLFEFVWVGHMHADGNTTQDGIPIIQTTNLQDGGIPTFDIVVIDYTARTINAVRVGTGSSRTISLVAV